MNNVLLYCRSGFEKECAAEIIDKAAQQGVAGFVSLEADTGYVLFHCQQPGDAACLLRTLPFTSLIFARQMLLVGELLENLPAADRLTPIVAALNGKPQAGEVRVEVPDNDVCKPLLTFCRKLTVPLRQRLRNEGLLTHSEQPQRPVIHLLFITTHCCYVGYSRPGNRSPFFMGIPRLKLPPEAPSRSTLKLEEAFHVFIPAHDWPQRLANGMRAVDLGASPGGWSYQLVRRNMWVQAIDNGPLAQSLLDSGQVSWHQQDGFKYRPSRRNDWLVCDMVDKPGKVAALIVQWLVNGWCQETIFNLKLPMKKRYQQVQQLLDGISEQLQAARIPVLLQAKQLYHDRQEITVHIQRL